MSVRRMSLIEVRAKLEELIELGEEILIVSGGEELATLKPLTKAPRARRAESKDPERLAELGEERDDERDGIELLLDVAASGEEEEDDA